MELPKNRFVLAASIALAALLTAAALGAIVWPALVRPEPPLEASRDDGLRISLVEPPKAPSASGGALSRLDVGLSETAQAMAKGREALFPSTPQAVPPPAPPARHASPEPVPEPAWADAPEDLAPPEPVEDHWTGEARRRDRFEEARRRRWEDEERGARLDREADREARLAWERDQRDRRREEEPRYDTRDPPPMPDEDRAPSSSRW